MLRSECLAPVETMISLRSYLRPLSLSSFSAMAAFSSGMPSLATYLVKLASMAALAARLMGSGVGKSGSPAEKSTTSMPSARICPARAEILSVGDSAIRFTRSESMANP